MRDRYTITITGHRGSRHFSLTPKIQKWLLGSAAALGSLLVIGGLLVAGLSLNAASLNREISALETTRNSLASSNDELLNIRGRLQDRIDMQAAELGPA